MKKYSIATLLLSFVALTAQAGFIDTKTLNDRINGNDAAQAYALGFILGVASDTRICVPEGVSGKFLFTRIGEVITSVSKGANGESALKLDARDSVAFILTKMYPCVGV
jgi:hypothetical protein